MINERISLRWLSDDALVAELRRYASQSRDFSPAAADQYDALADRLEKTVADRDAWKFAAETLGPEGPDQKLPGFPKRRRRIMSEREGRSG